MNTEKAMLQREVQRRMERPLNDIAIRKLNLNHCKLECVPEDIFFKLTHLTHLYLYENALTTVSEDISSLSLLTNLSVSCNDLIELPQSITKLTNLVSLSAHDNRLRQLPDGFSALICLQSLYLQSNGISIFFFPFHVHVRTQTNTIQHNTTMQHNIRIEIHS